MISMFRQNLKKLFFNKCREQSYKQLCNDLKWCSSITKNISWWRDSDYNEFNSELRKTSWASPINWTFVLSSIQLVYSSLVTWGWLMFLRRFFTNFSKLAEEFTKVWIKEFRLPKSDYKNVNNVVFLGLDSFWRRHEQWWMVPWSVT